MGGNIMETKLKKLVLEGFYHEAENLMLTIHKEI